MRRGRVASSLFVFRRARRTAGTGGKRRGLIVVKNGEKVFHRAYILALVALPLRFFRIFAKNDNILSYEDCVNWLREDGPYHRTYCERERS